MLRRCLHSLAKVDTVLLEVLGYVLDDHVFTQLVVSSEVAQVDQFRQ